jgi:hypothetical protein
MIHSGKQEDGHTFICVDGKYHIITEVGTCQGVCPECFDSSIYADAVDDRNDENGSS